MVRQVPALVDGSGATCAHVVCTILVRRHARWIVLGRRGQCWLTALLMVEHWVQNNSSMAAT